MEIRIYILDKEQLFRELLAKSLATVNDPLHFSIAGVAGNGIDALEHMTRIDPVDVVIMDGQLPDIDGEAVIRQLIDSFPTIRVILLTECIDPEWVMRGLMAGAKSYLLKSIGLADLIQAITLVLQGQSPIHPLVANTMLSELMKLMDNPNHEIQRKNGVLTEREWEVLRLITLGRSNSEISKVLFITEGTVKCHVSRIFSKLGIRNRVQAVMYAQSNGLSEYPEAIGLGPELPSRSTELNYVLARIPGLESDLSH